MINSNPMATVTKPWISVSGKFTPTLLKTDFLMEIFKDQEASIAEVLSVFRQESKDFMNAASGHFTQQDFLSLRKAAHAMKPTGSYIGVDSLTALMASLEKSCQCGDIRQEHDLLRQIQSTLDQLNGEIEYYLSHPANRH